MYVRLDQSRSSHGNRSLRTKTFGRIFLSITKFTEVCSTVSVLSHRSHICLQMHDIVKAVGNCSYNQLVEKIISCKQSDSSELAGEGECCFLIVPAPPPFHFSLCFHYMGHVYRTMRVEIKLGRTRGSSSK